MVPASKDFDSNEDTGMSSPRLRRLQSDFDEVSSRFGGNGPIRIVSTRGKPPEKYEFEFTAKSLELVADGRIVERSTHSVEVTLTSAYPRQSPQCKMLTPVFHPNIDSAAICIGDHWAAGESLADLVCRIGEMLAYQSYNVKSPLNGEAARWADEHQTILPIDRTDFFKENTEDDPPTLTEVAVASAPVLKRCNNCGAPESLGALTETSPGAVYCADCILNCPECGNLMFLSDQTCFTCRSLLDSELAKIEVLLSNGEHSAALRAADDFLRSKPSEHRAIHLRQRAVSAVERARQLSKDAQQSYSRGEYIHFLEVCRQAKKLERLGHHIQFARKQIVLAENLVRSAAEQFPTNAIAAMETLRAAIQACSDYEPARKALSKVSKKVQSLEQSANNLSKQVEFLMLDALITRERVQELEEAGMELERVLGSLGADQSLAVQAKEMAQLWQADIDERAVLLKDRFRRTGVFCAITWVSVVLLLALVAGCLFETPEFVALYLGTVAGLLPAVATIAALTAGISIGTTIRWWVVARELKSL